MRKKTNNQSTFGRSSFETYNASNMIALSIKKNMTFIQEIALRMEIELPDTERGYQGLFRLAEFYNDMGQLDTFRFTPQVEEVLSLLYGQEERKEELQSIEEISNDFHAKLKLEQQGQRARVGVEGLNNLADNLQARSIYDQLYDGTTPEDSYFLRAEDLSMLINPDSYIGKIADQIPSIEIMGGEIHYAGNMQAPEENIAEWRQSNTSPIEALSHDQLTERTVSILADHIEAYIAVTHEKQCPSFDRGIWIHALTDATNESELNTRLDEQIEALKLNKDQKKHLIALGNAFLTAKSLLQRDISNQDIVLSMADEIETAIDTTKGRGKSLHIGKQSLRKKGSRFYQNMQGLPGVLRALTVQNTPTPSPQPLQNEEEEPNEHDWAGAANLNWLSQARSLLEQDPQLEQVLVPYVDQDDYHGVYRPSHWKLYIVKRNEEEDEIYDPPTDGVCGDWVIREIASRLTDKVSRISPSRAREPFRWANKYITSGDTNKNDTENDPTRHARLNLRSETINYIRECNGNKATLERIALAREKTETAILRFASPPSYHEARHEERENEDEEKTQPRTRTRTRTRRRASTITPAYKEGSDLEDYSQRTEEDYQELRELLAETTQSTTLECIDTPETQREENNSPQNNMRGGLLRAGSTVATYFNNAFYVVLNEIKSTRETAETEYAVANKEALEAREELRTANEEGERELLDEKIDLVRGAEILLQKLQQQFEDHTKEQLTRTGEGRHLHQRKCHDKP